MGRCIVLQLIDGKLFNLYKNFFSLRASSRYNVIFVVEDFWDVLIQIFTSDVVREDPSTLGPKFKIDYISGRYQKTFKLYNCHCDIQIQVCTTLDHWVYGVEAIVVQNPKIKICCHCNNFKNVVEVPRMEIQLRIDRNFCSVMKK